MSLASFQAAVRDIRRLALDTSVWLAAADASDPRQPCARWLIREVERGRFSVALIPTLTVAEALVRPVSASLAEGITAQTALRNFPNLTIAPLDFDTAVEVAHVRAVTKLKMSDAIVLGTAIAHQVEAIVHADDEWGKKVRPYAGALKLIHMSFGRTVVNATTC
ncbi:MAG: type II toxin-antitoxin system VapC family toxin [Chloroflexi bacterium]|nr:type II toxin-antitoxin system VapC family toxin [Chloroflexota bacterium]